MRDDTDKGTFQPVKLLKLLNRSLESTCSVLNPPFQSLVQFIEVLFRASSFGYAYRSYQGGHGNDGDEGL